jgi:hypothetical protein
MNYRVWLTGPDKLYSVPVHSSSPPTYGKNVAEEYGYILGDAWFRSDRVVAIVPGSAAPKAPGLAHRRIG